MVCLAFTRLVEDICSITGVAVSGQESVHVDRVPIDEKVDDGTTVGRKVSYQFVKGTNGHAIV
jgi:hypothetical protein